MLRTNTCGELTKRNLNKVVDLAGWVHTRRDHGGVIFIDLRDRYGLTQIVFDPSYNKKAHKEAEHLRREDVIHVKGKVKNRKTGMVNKKLKTGEIEVFVDSLNVLNKSEVPPLEVDDRKVATNEDLRLQYRYIDLRRPQMQHHLEVRHKIAQAARAYLSSNNFLEIETPILVRNTPEGARDYVVPSRVNPGKFYSLPQSPQLYKQILMVSGCDRYFQIARCLRDEDLRADRQPEHTQIDFEMSFVEEEDIYNLVDGLFKEIFKKARNVNLKTPFPRLTYKEAMEKYGSDKPDLRYGLELTDITDVAKKSDFSVFKDVIKSGGIVKCINPPKDMPRKEIDDLIDFSVKNGAKGMAWMRINKGKLESNIAKFFSDKIQKELLEKTKAKSGVLMFIADKEKKCNEILDKLRRELAERLNLIKEGFEFVWITDFPLFGWNEDEERWEPEHHMFTMPKDEFIGKLAKDPGKVTAKCYDLTLNGIELGSGSIRIHNPKIQEEVMKVVGLEKKDAERKFGFLLEAFKYGAPPHGGMGIGLDRVTALSLGFNDIREVMAFPKNKAAQNPMDGSPSEIDEKLLKELYIKLDKKK
jgi:aspartyl-tRNA synthetase